MRCDERKKSFGEDNFSYKIHVIYSFCWTHYSTGILDPGIIITLNYPNILSLFGSLFQDDLISRGAEIRISISNFIHQRKFEKKEKDDSLSSLLLLDIEFRGNLILRESGSPARSRHERATSFPELTVIRRPHAASSYS